MNEAREVRWKRRSAERPAEIAAAALAEFSERGYAAARLSDIAKRAGLSKAALYLYYPAKTDLFRAVLSEQATPNVARVFARLPEGRSLAETLGAVLAGVAGVMEARADFRRLVRVIIAESGNFPALASLWRETVVDPALDAVGTLIARAQTTGEARAGDPRLMAISVIAPLVTGLIWREVMEPSGGAVLDLRALAAEHALTLTDGLGTKAGD